MRGFLFWAKTDPKELLRRIPHSNGRRLWLNRIETKVSGLLLGWQEKPHICQKKKKKRFWKAGSPGETTARLINCPRPIREQHSRLVLVSNDLQQLSLLEALIGLHLIEDRKQLQTTGRLNAAHANG